MGGKMKDSFAIIPCYGIISLAVRSQLEVGKKHKAVVAGIIQIARKGRYSCPRIREHHQLLRSFRAILFEG